MTVKYSNGRPEFITAVVLSTQHADGIDIDTLMRPDLIEHVIRPVLPEGLYDPDFKQTKLYVNPTGKFVIGGPMGDTGLTGRKIIVDTYGGWGRHGGGAFSGKDPSKVDRSAAYAARYVAKNVVAAGLADRCEVQIAYAIGVAHPVSVMVDCFGTESDQPEDHPGTHHEPLRSAPGRHHPRPQAASAHLREDRRLRPLRPRGRRLHVGEHRQGRRAPQRRGSELGAREAAPRRT